MSLYAVVDSHGTVVKLVSGSEEQVLLNVGEGEEAIFDPYPGDAYWDHENSQWVPIPPQPSPVYEWDPYEKQWKDPRSLSAVKREAKARITAARDAAEDGSRFECDGAVYQSDLPRISGASLGALTALLNGQPFAVDWTLADNTVKTLDAPGMLRVGFAQFAHINALHQKARQLKAQIDAATTIAEVEAIQWSFP
ncbi:DUF4376 domain-containing protein [Caldimonas thermodepolymerans]|uniref:DUF4376 domain-containing protein n=1 Tax=Caldimonas thermodepolymerans TaxID=215580 RepID=A0A2S5T926_9BURK|nr:DUF4376 domain-containing protein [Caldimonas thermodepolymerans]PPE71483.1 hypothetical protein C1702_00315 [Caldimonas thermodepolymerans]QPC30510.1 DUF4376 domain-containing protein [Caldimonas thermodepolymerans]RDI02904.1 uncharacterized protein DUF4376 [Caldimonas thermodepolymerans]